MRRAQRRRPRDRGVGDDQAVDAARERDRDDVVERAQSSRSGAILTSSGRRGALASRASTTRATSASSASRRCRSRKPGVLGEETLIVR